MDEEWYICVSKAVLDYELLVPDSTITGSNGLVYTKYTEKKKELCLSQKNCFTWQCLSDSFFFKHLTIIKPLRWCGGGVLSMYEKKKNISCKWSVKIKKICNMLPFFPFIYHFHIQHIQSMKEFFEEFIDIRIFLLHWNLAVSLYKVIEIQENYFDDWIIIML